MAHGRRPGAWRWKQGLLGFWAFCALLGQPGGRRPFVVLGPEQGLPSAAILCVTQDKDGFLWLGTENGLLRYEGDQCSTWGLKEGLPSAFITRLLPDPAGGLWVGTLRGLVHFRHGRFERADLASEDTEPPYPRIAQDAQGRIWAALGRRLYVQEDGIRFRRMPWRLPGPASLIAIGRSNGTVYVGWRDGLRALAPDGTERTWTPQEGLPVGITEAIEDGLGRVWTGSGKRLAVLEPGQRRFRDASSLLPAPIHASGIPFRDGDGSVWLPTQGGALHITNLGHEVLDATVGLPFRWVRGIFRDREHTLWMVGPALARLQGGGRLRMFTMSRGAFGEVAWYIARDRQGGLVVGTDNGAARLGPRGLEPIHGTEGRRIKGLAVDPAGTLWMVTTTGPTQWLRAGHTQAETPPLGELGQGVNTVHVDHEGQVWLGSASHGVLRWDPSARRLVQAVPPAQLGMTALSAFQFNEDAQGRLWVGTTAGLLVRESQGWRLFTERDGLRAYTIYGEAFLPDGSA